MEQINTANTAQLPLRSAPHSSGTQARPTGLVGVDGRRREAKAWMRHYAAAMEASRGRSETLCRSFASLVVRREALDAKLARGEGVDTDLLLRVASEVRRTATCLGLIDADDEEPAVDATDEVIRHVRAATEAA